MKTHLILAHDFNLGIGKDNALPWHIEEELALFKHITNGKAVIMGRKTFDSLPFKNGLPNRMNVVISRSHNEVGDYDSNVRFVTSIESAIKLLESDYEDAYIIGGKSIYEASLELVTGNIYVSNIKDYFDCDTFIDDDKFYRKMLDLNFCRVFYKDLDKFFFTIHKRIKDI